MPPARLLSLFTLVSLLCPTAVPRPGTAGVPADSGQDARTEGQADAPEPLRVMTFNLWVGGEGGKRPLARTADAIRAAGADVVGLQEVSGREVNGVRPDNGKRLAELLGWNYHKQPGHSPAVVTRHRIVSTTPGGRGVLIETAAGPRVLLFNVHLNHAPYQPYQLLGIAYHDGRFIRTADEAVAEARAARGEEVAALLAEIAAASAEHPAVPVVVTGDFNEPSHLDWTPAAAAAGRCPLAVEWPGTKALAEAGFVDAYRARHPDPVESPSR